MPPTNIANPSRPTARPTGSMIIVTLRPRPTTMQHEAGDHEERVFDETDDEVDRNAPGAMNV